MEHWIIPPHWRSELAPLQGECLASPYKLRLASVLTCTASKMRRWMFLVGEVHVVEVLNEMIPPVEGPVCLRLVLTLLVLVTCKMHLIGGSFTTEGTNIEWALLGAAADPRGTQCMDRVFVSGPLVLRSKGPGAKGAEKRKVAGGLPGVVNAIGLWSGVRRVSPGHASATSSTLTTKRRCVAASGRHCV